MQFLHGSGKNEMCACSMELHCVISVISHESEMSLHLYLKMLLHNMRVNNKIYANNT